MLKSLQKFAAYQAEGVAPVAIFIEPERTFKEAMARLLGANKDGLALLAQYGPKK